MVDWNQTALEQAQFNNAETFAVLYLSEVTCSGNLLPSFNPLANAYLNIDNMLNFPNPTTLISSYHHCVIIIPQGVDVGDCARKGKFDVLVASSRQVSIPEGGMGPRRSLWSLQWIVYLEHVRLIQKRKIG